VRSCTAAALLSGVVLAAVSHGALAQSGAATFTPRDESPEDYPAGPGRDDTFYACTACHGFKLIAAQGLTRRQWDESVNLMRRSHNMPPLEGNDRKIVLDYLETTFPPRTARSAGWQNPFVKE
jgi:hypothetical protein